MKTKLLKSLGVLAALILPGGFVVLSAYVAYRQYRARTAKALR